METPVVMPQLGESVVEGTVRRWIAKEGEVVQRGQPLVEVETDKATAEVPSPAAGRLSRILARADEVVPTGRPIALLETGESGGVVASAQRATPPVPAPAPVMKPQAAPPSPPEVRLSEDLQSAAHPMGRRPAEPARAIAAEEARGEASGEPAALSPAVRSLVREHGVDLTAIRGTGRHGRVTRRDVERHLEQIAAGGAAAPVGTAPPRSTATAPEPAAATESGGAPGVGVAPFGYRLPLVRPEDGDEVVPMSRRRKLIAGHMVASKAVAPHVTTVAEVDMKRVEAARQALKPEAMAAGLELSYLAFVVAATARGLRQHPGMNAAVMGESVVLRRAVRLGIAVDTGEGLIVPVLRNPEELSVLGLAHAIGELARKARAGTLAPDEATGGTFTVSNPGRHGNLFGGPIINQPQVGIVRMGEVVKRAVVRELDGEDAIVIRPIMMLALSYDHRAVDGALANAFLHTVRGELEGWSSLAVA